MSIDRDIRIIDLLARREAEFMKVHALEEEVRTLLGGAAFPFPGIQADLPSRHPRRKAAVSGRQPDAEEAVASSARSCPGFRELHRPQENCYHLFYVDENGQKQESFQNDERLLEEIFRLQSDEFQITGIETVFFESMDQWHRVELIFGQPGETE